MEPRKRRSGDVGAATLVLVEKPMKAGKERDDVMVDI